MKGNTPPPPPPIYGPSKDLAISTVKRNPTVNIEQSDDLKRHNNQFS